MSFLKVTIMFFLLVFLDKFILHDLIAFLAMGGEKRTILSFDGRYSKRKGVLLVR